MAAHRDSLFQLTAVGKRYPRTDALVDVNLSLHPGERVAFLGPSGAGKSTLLRVLNTTAAPTSGQLRFDGRDVARAGERELRRIRRRIATIYQQYHLVPQLSVLDNVRAGRVGRWGLSRTLLPFTSSAERRTVWALLERVGIPEKLYERVDRLSGGQQQRVAIARALYQEPDVLLADEPLAALDPPRAEKLLELLLALAGEGRTFCITSHDLDLVLQHFPRVVGLRDGRIAFDCPSREVSAAMVGQLYASPRAFARVPASLAPAGQPPLLPPEVLSIGASSAPLDALVPRALAAFRAAEPAVRVKVQGATTQELVQAVRAGRLALALVGLRADDPELECEPVADDAILLVASTRLRGLPGHPLALTQVGHLPRVERPPGSATRELVEEWFERAGAPLAPEAIVAELTTTHALRAAVAEGLGCGFFSRATVAEELAAGHLVELKVEHLAISRQLFAVRRKGEPSPAVRAFLETVRSLGRAQARAASEGR
ncbi:MAG TPA: LysR substrate-binding domain-containing protein [Myxococcaceae bacterium]|nr:LysR substrate-binding domain-containing protein [Myxococcaceae bacterium]